jgi:hypothetical protein
MNFINPIPNAEFQIGIVCALMCIMFIFLYVGVKLINRIEELRADMVQEDKATHNHIVKYVTKELNELSGKSRAKYEAIINEVQVIKAHLYRPLYEVGNTIWYNRGNDGKPGVFEDHKAIIKSIIALPGEMPVYLVKGNEDTIEVLVHQSLIIAWTN